MKDCSQSIDPKLIYVLDIHSVLFLSQVSFLVKKIQSIMAEKSTYNRAIGRSENPGEQGDQ